MFAKFESNKQQKNAQNYSKRQGHKQMLSNNIDNSMRFLKISENIDFIQRTNKDAKNRNGKDNLTEQKS